MIPVLKKRSQLFLAGVWAGLARLGAAATAAVLGLNSRCLLPAVWPRRAEARGRVRACCVADMLAMVYNVQNCRSLLTCWWLRACCCRENCGLRGSCAATLFLAAALRP